MFSEFISQQFMKGWYNQNYQRMGYLFQDRFKSEPVNDNSSFIDIDKILALFPNHEECLQYLHTTSDQRCMEYYSSSRLPDAEALKIIRQKTPCNSPSDFQCLELPIRNHYLHLLYHSGISIRQLSRLTGISRTVISNAVKYNVT